MPRSAVKTYNRVSNRKTAKIEKRTGKPLTSHQKANVERRATRQMNRKMAHSRGEKTGKGTEYYKGSKKWAKEKGKGKYGSGPSKSKPAPKTDSKPVQNTRPKRQGGGPGRTDHNAGGMQQGRMAAPQTYSPQQDAQIQAAPFQASAQPPVAIAPGQEQAMQQYMQQRPQGAGPYGGALAGQMAGAFGGQPMPMPQIGQLGQMGMKPGGVPQQLPGMQQPGFGGGVR